MKKIIKYSMGVLISLNSVAYAATEKFEVLPDLPDPLAYAVQPAAAAAVSGATEPVVMTSQSIGHEPSLISVVLSLFFVILLIYLTGIIYTKLNKIGAKNLKGNQGEFSKSHVSVISTTPLGNNKTLHVVELDGKRMLIGASTSAIQLIKDLGNVNSVEGDDEFSHIEIPNIKIPKIEIPKIEIPSINFSKLITKTHKPMNDFEKEVGMQEEVPEKVEQNTVSEEVKEVKTEEDSDTIIDSLFIQEEPVVEEVVVNIPSEHVVDPDDFALYKKYLN